MNNKFLIVRPKYGLCNQLHAISKGIIFAIITRRNIYFNSFQIDYRNENNICEFHEVIDIVHLQKIVDQYNIKIYSDMNINGKKIETLTNINISYIKDFIPLLFYNNNINEDYLDIDNPICAVIPTEYNNILNYINLNIKFSDKYINIANNIKNMLNIKTYGSIHLRLEDDGINFIKNLKNLDFESVNNMCKQKYINELDNITNKFDGTYVCTSLIINENVNNDFYKELKIKYNLIDKNDIINIIDIKNDCREIYGIIDFLIAKDSIFFIGIDWSSFSLYVYNNHVAFSKYTKIINTLQETNIV